MNTRIVGIDVARAIAIFGMVIVNFKLSFGVYGEPFFEQITDIIEGKAAALFVVLAGVGIALLTNAAVRFKLLDKMQKIRIQILKKSVFLLVIGLLFYPFWFADILHFYGFYMVVAIIFINTKPWNILFTSFVVIGSYPFLMMFFDYDLGWNYKTFEYLNFWTPTGFIRNLLFNGFHPLIPWVGFILMGLWLGKQKLNDIDFVRKAFWISLQLYAIILFFSMYIQSSLVGVEGFTSENLNLLFGTTPMPPLPFYMISAGLFSVMVISGCIWFSKQFSTHFLVVALQKTGQLALTFYIAHVLIGISIVGFLNPSRMGNYAVEFSVYYGVGFCILCVLFANIWLKYFHAGPLEWVMRRLTM